MVEIVQEMDSGNGSNSFSLHLRCPYVHLCQSLIYCLYSVWSRFPTREPMCECVLSKIHVDVAFSNEHNSGLWTSPLSLLNGVDRSWFPGQVHSCDQREINAREKLYWLGCQRNLSVQTLISWQLSCLCCPGGNIS